MSITNSTPSRQCGLPLKRSFPFPSLTPTLLVCSADCRALPDSSLILLTKARKSPMQGNKKRNKLMRESDGEMKHADHVSLSPSCQKVETDGRTRTDATKVDKPAPAKATESHSDLGKRSWLCRSAKRDKEKRETLTPRFSISNYNDSTEDRIKYIFQPSKRDWFGISQVRKLW